MLVLHHAGGVFQQAGDAGAVKVQQLFTAAVGGHEQGVIVHDLGCPGQAAVEFGLDLEKFAVIRVHVKQQVVDPGGADHDDLGLHRYRFGLEGYHGHETVLLQHVLDADVAGADAAFERIPHKGVDQYLPGVDDQVAAIGAVQGARADHGEVGYCDAAVLHDMLDAPKEVVVGGV